jgi:hypothetical protein
VADMTIQPAPRTVKLTVWKVEAETIDISPQIAVTRIYASARGEGIDHRYEVYPSDRVCIGDTVTLDITPPRQAGT